MTEQPADQAPPAGQASPTPPAATDLFDLPVSLTGEAGVDAALAELGRLGALPTFAHAELYQDVHARLADVLAGAGGDAVGDAGDAP